MIDKISELSPHQSGLSPRQKIGQLFFIGIPGTEVDRQTRSLLDEISPGGICLFARNIREAAQTRSLLDELRDTMFPRPLLSLDQEGGTVDRLRRLVTPMAPARRVRTAEEAGEMAILIAETIMLLGFNMDFAPVVDVVEGDRSGSSNGLFTRPFGRTKEETAALAGEFLRVLQRGGPIGCIKHFPGLGGAGADSHEELPSVTIDESELRNIDLYPYRELISAGDAHAVMVAHACYPALSLQEMDGSGKLLPSSLSKNIITTLLRDELLFDGLVITDDLEMGAIVKNYGIGEACVMAFEAGADMLAICADPKNIRDGFDAMNAAFEQGRFDEDRLSASLDRIEQIRSKLREPPEFDPAKLVQLSLGIETFNSRLEPI
jgi:beta-N-acetylhexosaminidase